MDKTSNNDDNIDNHNHNYNNHNIFKLCYKHDNSLYTRCCYSQ